MERIQRTVIPPRLGMPLFIALLSGISTNLTAANDKQIFKQISTNGSVEFSDQEAHNSTPVIPTAINIMASPPPPVAATAADSQLNGDDKQNPGTAQAKSDDALTLSKPTIATTYKAPPVAKVGDITRVDIIAPSQSQTHFEHQKSLKVHYYTLPAKKLADDQSARIRLNNNFVAHSKLNQISLPMPKTGMHQLQVEIVDDKGKVLAQSTLIEVLVEKLVVPLTIR